MADTSRFVADTIARAWRRFADDARFFGPALAGVSVAWMLVDGFVPDHAQNVANTAIGLALVHLQLVATFRTLAAAHALPPGYDPAHPSDRRYLAAVGLNIVSWVAILVGLVLLLVPGVLLFAIWSLALPALAGERLAVIDALRRSRALAMPLLGPILLLMLALVVPLAAVILALFAVSLTGALPERTMLLLLDVVLAFAMLFGPVVWALAYVRCRNHSDAGA